MTEYRRHVLVCWVCAHETAAAWPAELPDGGFGPRVQATVGYLTGRLGVSQRDVEEVMDSLSHVNVSLGSVAALEQAVSAALAQPVAAAQTYVQAQPAINADATSWREGQARAWVWLAATPWVAVFLVLASRGTKSAKQLKSQTGVRFNPGANRHCERLLRSNLIHARDCFASYLATANDAPRNDAPSN